MSARRSLLGVLVVVLVLVPARAFADLTAAERKLLEVLDVARTEANTRRYATGIVKTRSGAGAGTAVAGSAEERQIADAIERDFKSLGLTVRRESFPVRHYEFGEVHLTAAGRAVPAVSLHAAGGTWGSVDGVPYARGNTGNGRVVRTPLVDVGKGHVSDYAHAGDVRGKVVLVQRVGWPTYEILEAAHRGAAALLLYDYPGARDDTIKQDSMWYHEQLPTASISRGDATRLKQDLARGTVEIGLENRIDVSDGQSQNVIATITGKELPDEWVLVSAHYDRWFEAAQDNSVGVAVMLELARAFANGSAPRRSFMFIGMGAEEAGIEATESDWLAGSHAFIRAHPEITRRLAYAFNVDRAGWTGAKGIIYATTDTVPFQKQIVDDLGLADRMTVRGSISSNVDAWNFGPVGGGAVGYVNWDSDVMGERGSYAPLYHTQFDVFRAEDYGNLQHDLRIGALSLYRIDQTRALPISLAETADWVDRALTADGARAPDVSFDAARAALASFREQVVLIERLRESMADASVRPLNRWLMRVRKDLVPWLMARGQGGFRTSAPANALASLTLARTAAESGDLVATRQALEKMPDVANARRVSPEVFEAQRLYWYTSGDWSVEYEHKARPIRTTLVEIDRRIAAGGGVAAEVDGLRQLEAESRGRLAEALFVIAGKLQAAATALQRLPASAAGTSAAR